LEERKEVRELKIGDAGHAHHGRQPRRRRRGERGGSTRSGRRCGKRKPGRDSNVVTGAAGGASRRNSPRGAGKPVQLSGTGESKGRCTTDGRAERFGGGFAAVCSELAFLRMQVCVRRGGGEKRRVADENGTANKSAACCRRFCFGASLALL
jgi:hypothetical protein